MISAHVSVGPALTLHGKGYTFQGFAAAHACPCCHVMRFFFINRHGRTLCWMCDGEVHDD